MPSDEVRRPTLSRKEGEEKAEAYRKLFESIVPKYKFAHNTAILIEVRCSGNSSPCDDRIKGRRRLVRLIKYDDMSCVEGPEAAIKAIRVLGVGHVSVRFALPCATLKNPQHKAICYGRRGINSLDLINRC